MSAKITIREIDGTEYQLKKRLAQMVLQAGFSRRVERGLHEMVRVSLPYALRIIELGSRDFDRGKLRPEGPPECCIATYPAPNQVTAPAPFGSKQDWSHF